LDCAVGARFWVRWGAEAGGTLHEVERRLHRNLAGRDQILVWEECWPRSTSKNTEAPRRNCRKSGQPRPASFRTRPEPGSGRNLRGAQNLGVRREVDRCRPSRNPQGPVRNRCNSGQPIVAMCRRAPSQTIVGHLSLHGTGSVSLSSLPLDSPASVVVPGCDPAVTASFWVEPKNENGHRTPLKPTTFYAVFLLITPS
jgi:hypothetical protein